MKNPNSIVFKNGGIYKEGTLVAGSFGTISTTDVSVQLIKFSSGLIRKAFSKIGTLYVGENAKLNCRAVGDL